MRVIAGTARGRRLEAPRDNDTRPTAEIVKEAAMSIVQLEIPGAVFLDLFAGSGQMGIEALSRGARRCILVDQAKGAAQLIRRNLETCGFSPMASVITADAVSWVRRGGETIDLAFLDPPYEQGLPQKLLPELAERMRDNGVILVETAAGEQLPPRAGRFALEKQYRYGKRMLTKYTLSEEAPE
jgi:16S rRNA (guanine(966)-N(2))-methyltransferase RsmD